MNEQPESTPVETKRMNPEIKAKWVAALLSGKYEQGTGVLKTQDGKFCCLGVLCDILGKEFKERGYYSENEKGFFVDGNALGLSPDIQDEVGLMESEPTVQVRGRSSALSYLNDNGFSFAEIAA